MIIQNSELTLSGLKKLYEKNLDSICKIAVGCDTCADFKKSINTFMADNNLPDAEAEQNMRNLIEHDGKKIKELSTGEELEINTLTLLWKWLKGLANDDEITVDFALDLYCQFLRLTGQHPADQASPAKVKKWMRRWPSGMDDEIKKVRRTNKERIINCLVEKIDARQASASQYSFNEGMTLDDKHDKVREWWFDYKFQLAMAARSIREINRMLGHSLPQEVIRLYHEARRKGIPVFVTPYYLSLLNTGNEGYDDSAIRSYIFYSNELVDAFGQIKAWEKEDMVEPGKPNAAGWLLPEGNNIHRRYPDVAILIPDSMGRACGGLCASCQRMYDFQSRRFNFDFEKLKPNETWKHKLHRLMKYFENDSQLCDILITGGDALMSSNKTLRNILKEVLRMAKNKRAANLNRPDGEKYAEIKRVRLGTRLPVYLPMRVNGPLLEILAEFKEEAQKLGIEQFFVQTHFQTPLEMTPEANRAVRSLQEAGWVVTNQLVFNVAASRRGHTAKLRKVLNACGVFCYYTFSVKGFDENHAPFVPNCRSMQESAEEKAIGKIDKQTEDLFMEKYAKSRFKSTEIRKFCNETEIPFLATDRNVLNLPGIGKSMAFNLAGIMSDGRRILAFTHDNTRKHSPVIRGTEQVYIKENKSVYEYLIQLKGMGERLDEYNTIWNYTSGKTERRFKLYEYPLDESQITKKYTNLSHGNTE